MTAVKLTLTVARVREVLDYDATSGVFTWRETRCGMARRGQVAGTVGQYGYVIIMVDRVLYKAHRLAWFYVTGEWPARGIEIDHINGVRADNRFANLRPASDCVNAQNIRRPRGRSGYLGVSQDRQSKKWKAAITANHVRIYLGRFSSPERAHAAYLKAKRALHQGCTI